MLGRALCHDPPGQQQRNQCGKATERKRGGWTGDSVNKAGYRVRACAGNADTRGMQRHGARLRIALQSVGDGFEAWHIGACPTDPGDRAKNQCRPEPVSDKRKTQMRQHREACTYGIDPPRRDSIRE
jgi:hypothetical protein